MDDETLALIERVADRIATAITRVAHGAEQPTGLEMLAMSIAPDGHGNDLASQVSTGLNDVADAVRQHAAAIDRLAQAINRRT